MLIIYEDILIKGALSYGVTLNETQIKQFIKYKDLLKEWNQKINLTAIEEDSEIMQKHFVDSLSILPYLPKKNISLIDVGTGAGFPGIPLIIVNPSIKVTLLDSLDKRVKFLNEVITQLELKEINAFHGRAEEYGIKQAHREKYDVATARAVASLPALSEYCMPYVKVGGYFIAMKGNNKDEIEQSHKAINILGGEIEKVYDIFLPDSDIKRSIVVIKKLRQTPPKYPRIAGKPAKEPLI